MALSIRATGAAAYLAVVGALSGVVRHVVFEMQLAPGLASDVLVNVPAALLVAVAAAIAAVVAERVAPSARPRWAPLALGAGSAALGMISLGLALLALGGAAGVWLATQLVGVSRSARLPAALQLFGVLVVTLSIAYFVGRHESNLVELAFSAATIPLVAAVIGAAGAMVSLRRAFEAADRR